MISLISSVVSKYVESASEKKREFVRTKYKLDPEAIPLLEAADPTPHAEYLDWLAKAYSKGTIRLPEDTKKLKDLLIEFREFRKDHEYPGSKDINQYKTTQDLYRTLKEFKDFQKSKDLNTPPSPEYVPSDAKLVVKGPDYEWYAITSVDSALAVAEGTNWCTGDDPGTAASYLKQGPLYVLYKSGEPEVQAHFPTGQFRDTAAARVADVFLYKVKCKRYCPELSHLFSAVKTRYVFVSDYDEGGWDESIISRSPKMSYEYAKDILDGKRFPAGEAAIATDPERAYFYAREVLKGKRFPAGEAVIAKDLKWAYYYARDVLKGPFPAGEAAIATDPYWAYEYARYVLEGPFPAGELAIAKIPGVARRYVDYLKSIKVEVPPAFEGILLIYRDTF